MSQPPYGPPGSAGDGSPQVNPNTGLPEPQHSPEAPQYEAPSYGGAPEYEAPSYDQTQQHGAPSYGEAPQYNADQTAAYGSQPGSGPYQTAHSGNQYSSDPYGTSAAASPYGSQPGAYGGAPQSVPMGGVGTAQGESDKSFVVTWLLGWLLGSLGLDRFYLGKIGTAIAKLLTAGGLGVWALVDLIMHLVGATRDTQGRRLAGYDRHKKLAWIVTIGVWLLQVIVGIIILIVVIAAGGISTSTTTTGPDSDPDTSQQDDPSTGDQSDTGDTGGQDAPAPGDVVAWAESTYGTYDPVTVDGNGNQLVPVPDGVDAAIITVMAHSDNTSVTALNADGENYGDIYVFLMDGESGQGSLGINDYDVITDIEVTSSGDWSMTFDPIASLPAFPESGTDAGFYLYGGPGGTADFEYVGENNIIISQYDDSFGNLVVNEIDSYSGTVELDPGPSLMQVIATGDWSLTMH